MYVKTCPRLLSLRRSNFITLIGQRHKSGLISQTSFKDYEKAIPKIIDKIPLETFRFEITEIVKKISDCSLKSNENIPGPLTIHAYKILEKPDKITENSMNDVRTLAWGAEMVHSYSMLLDDVENNGTRENGNSCWHVHDASLLRSFVYEILKTIITNKSLYADLVHLFDKAFLYTAIGCYMNNASTHKNDYKNFTIDRFNSAIEFKTFNIFNFPILLAMKITNNDACFNNHQVESICRDIGILYQMQMDYLNCYGEVSEHPGLPTHSTDIQAGRSSWLAISALQRCNPAQRVVLTSCYGSKQPAHIERVKLLYDQLEMPNVYKEQQNKLLGIIQNKVRKLDGTKLRPELFTKVIDVIKK